jgi:hypothetical protein
MVALTGFYYPRRVFNLSMIAIRGTGWNGGRKSGTESRAIAEAGHHGLVSMSDRLAPPTTLNRGSSRASAAAAISPAQAAYPAPST